MRWLHSIPSLDPARGGPVQWLRQMHRLLGDEHEIEVVSLDPPGADFVKASPMRVHALGPVSSFYGYAPRFVPWLREHRQRFDAVVVNGIWQYTSFGVWRALRGSRTPYCVFTHGMLDPWFKQAYPLKHLKKWLYWPWAEYRVLRDAAQVFFTSEEERLLARRSFWLYRARERVLHYGAAGPEENLDAAREVFFAAHPECRGRRIVLFLGRIHEKKGCDLLLDAFAESASIHGGLHLVMAGPESACGEKLRARGTPRVTWTGMLSGMRKWGAFAAANVFALPSHQENFGIAVAEALACGVPVLISNKVNIWREIESAGAGFAGDDTVEGTRTLLARWLALDEPRDADMRRRARVCFQTHFRIEASAESFAAALREIVSHAR